MLVVLGIIGLVTAMAIPMMIPFMRGRKIEQSADMVKSACLMARGRAVKERKRFCVVVLEVERKIYVCDYEQLRYVLPVKETGTTGGDSEVENEGAGTPATLDRESSTSDWSGYFATMASGTTTGVQRRITGLDATEPTKLELDEDWPGGDLPAVDDEYIVGGAGNGNVHKYVAPHYISNYADAEQRDFVLDKFAVIRPKILPEGCRFDLDRDGSDPNAPEAQGWTYVFSPTGGVATLDTDAQNEKDEHWSETTFRESSGEFAGPRIYGPQDGQVVNIVVYAMTGQAVSE